MAGRRWRGSLMQILPLIPLSSPSSPMAWKLSNFDANCCKWARPPSPEPSTSHHITSHHITNADDGHSLFVRYLYVAIPFTDFRRRTLGVRSARSEKERASENVEALSVIARSRSVKTTVLYAILMCKHTHNSPRIFANDASFSLTHIQNRCTVGHFAQVTEQDR